MVYVTKKELNIILKDYNGVKTFLVKNRLLDRYIKTNKSSRSYFDRRINVVNKMIKAKTR